MAKIINFISSACHRVIIIAVSIVLWLILLPSLPILLIFACHYALAVLLASKIRPELSVVSGPEASFATEPVYSHPYMTIIWNLVCEGNISVEQLRERFKERVFEYRDPKKGLIYRRLCHKWTTFLGYFFWELDRNFDLNHHVRLYDYNDQPGMSLTSAGASCTEEALVRVTGKLFTQPFKNDTSPWELLLIPNYKLSDSSDGSGIRQPKTVFCLRIHHGLADGFSILGLVHRLFDQSLSLPTSTTRPGGLVRIVKRLVCLSLFPYVLARAISEGFDRQTAWHPVGKALSGDNVTFCSGRVPWKHVRAIMSKYGVSSNAAVYAIAVGSVARLMQEAGLDVPKGSLSTVIPFPKPNHPGGLTNHTSATYFTFNPGVHSNAKSLIQHVGKQIRRAHEGDRTADMIGSFQTISSLFPVWLWRCIFKRSASQTFLFSNFPGPQQVLETDGVRLSDIICCVGHDAATGIYGVMLTTCGYQRFVINLDRSILEGRPIPTGFSQHVADMINELLNDNVPEIV